MSATQRTPAEPELVQAIDALLESELNASEPGAAVLVARHGHVLYRGGRGMANLELAVPLAPGMIFRLGSMTKQFTGVAILLLVREGAVRLEDEITTYLPAYPTQGQCITVEQLLTHTSGIKPYTEMPEWMSQMRTDVSLDALIALFQDQPMDFAPGECWKYNNSAYILAGAIIETVTGQSYSAFLDQRVFRPLGMTHTSPDQTTQVVRGRVAGYQTGTEGFEHAPFLSMTWPHAAGALMSSVDDLLLWDEALYTERLLPRHLLERAFTPARLNDGTSTGYGYGWFVGAYAGHRTISHGGDLPGFTTHGLRLPDEHLFVAVLMNGAGLRLSPILLSVKLAGLALGAPFQHPQAITLAPALLDAYTGVYDERENTVQTITREGETLSVQWWHGGRDALICIAESEFVRATNPLTRLRFVRDATGTVARLEVYDVLGLGGPVLRSTRTAKPLRPDDTTL